MKQRGGHDFAHNNCTARSTFHVKSKICSEASSWHQGITYPVARWEGLPPSGGGVADPLAREGALPMRGSARREDLSHNRAILCTISCSQLGLLTCYLQSKQNTEKKTAGRGNKTSSKSSSSPFLVVRSINIAQPNSRLQRNILRRAKK